MQNDFFFRNKVIILWGAVEYNLLENNPSKETVNKSKNWSSDGSWFYWL